MRDEPHNVEHKEKNEHDFFVQTTNFKKKKTEKLKLVEMNLNTLIAAMKLWRRWKCVNKFINIEQKEKKVAAAAASNEKYKINNRLFWSWNFTLRWYT